MKIKDVIDEAVDTIGTRAARDITGSDYEKDPETGELTGRREPSPTFASMLLRVSDKHAADSGSMMYRPENTPKEKLDVTKVPVNSVLVTTTRDGRQYFKFPPSEDRTVPLSLPSGTWKDAKGRPILNQQSVIALEKLAKQNGKFIHKSQLPSQEPQEPESPIASADEPMPASTEAPLHPDVSVLQSYPLVFQYKGKRFEMDDYGIWHPFGTTGKVTPALQTFLTKERGKL